MKNFLIHILLIVLGIFIGAVTGYYGLIYTLEVIDKLFFSDVTGGVALASGWPMLFLTTPALAVITPVLLIIFYRQSIKKI